MNKKSLFQTLWININRRLPPDSNQEILIWLPKNNIGIFPIKAFEARKAAIKLLENKENYKTMPPSRIFSQWMPIYPPKVYEEAWEKYQKEMENVPF